ncbi:hypothetical protein ACO0RG_002880 [Hanseniaspora osmophila]|uniref:Oxysterol-binding 4 n=1 Tax=Hanseniaspora osmophila TaxID=56408 RepID=A0A1E5R944_9ASCO|nr:Oxysterol-binding 4 [Hanseniaspora osmophila]
MGESSKSSSTANSSSWTSFLKSIANFNGDLSSLTAPPFILSPVSLTEYSQYWAEHPDLLLSINNAVNKNTFEPSFPSVVEYTPDLVKMLHVVRWFISTLKSQYCSRNESMGTEKKPLNPFLGELFVGKWEHEQNGSVTADLGDTVCLSEQVSHHPPITAYSIFNEKTNVSLEGYNQIKSTFSSASLSVKQYGHALLRCKNKEQQEQKDDTFLITLPSLHIEGLLLAAPFVELDSKSYIQSSSGYFAIIEYSGRGYFSGKKNSFKCKIYKSYESYIYDKEGKPSSSASQEASGSSSEKQNNKEDKKPLFVISGQWSGISNIYTSSSDEKKRKNGQVFYDASRVAAEHLHVKPIEKQNPWESRRAWEKVANAIKSGDYNLIHQEKSQLEEEQRMLRLSEQEKNTTWKTRWFDNSSINSVQNEDFVSLAKMCNLSVKNVPSGTRVGDKYDTHASASTDGSNGDEVVKHWRFVKENWANETEITL